MNFKYDIIVILVVAICTLATRMVPFVLFGGNKKPPRIVTYLGNILPSTVIAILVVYCLKGIHFETSSGFAPSLIAVAVTAVLHLWKRNNLLSIGAGTVCYMVLVQHVFMAG